MSRIRRAGVAWVVLAVLLVPLAGCGSGDSESTTTTAASQPPPPSRTTTKREHPSPQPLLAEMLPHSEADSDAISTDLLDHITNGWRASNGRTTFEVYAGADPYSKGRSTGRFLIVWTGDKSLGNSPDEVDVAHAGALTITDAPLGDLSSNRPEGELAFRSESGIRGTLFVPGDTVSLSPGGSG